MTESATITKLHKAIKRLHHPLEVMLGCAR
jgi:hypothetical protein